MGNSENESLRLRLLGPVADSAGKALNNVWEYVFGGINLFLEKKNYERQKNFEDFKLSFENRVNEIPSEELKAPKISLLGPTLEASKFYYEEKPLRDMFASLAAATMDKRKEHDLHPSYPEIIKQMSPLDAENLAFFSEPCPLAEYYSKEKNENSKVILMNNVFIENEAITDLFLQSMSISSLERLGLIVVTYEAYLSKNDYKDFYTTDLFLKMSLSEQQQGRICGLDRGYGKATSLGDAFISVCLPSELHRP